MHNSFKTEILVKNRNFGQSCIQRCSKFEILNYGQKSNVVRNSKFWSKIEFLFENRHFGQKLDFCSKIEILVKNPNFGR